MKISPKQMEHMMRQLGVQMENIDAEEVVIKTSGKDIVIKNPEVAKIKAMGKESFQISGDISERTKISDDDINLVAEQTGASREEAEKALNETGGIAEAIVKIKEQRK
jgi:nascent polypeptide-associated complex subunit alpha